MNKGRDKVVFFFRLCWTKLKYAVRGIAIIEASPQVHHEKHGAIILEITKVYGALQKLDNSSEPYEQVLWESRKRCRNPEVLRQFGLEKNH